MSLNFKRSIELNNAINQDMQSMRPDTNYDFILEISRFVVKKNVGYSYKEVEMDMSFDKVKAIALDFFKDIDNMFFNQAYEIIHGKSNIIFHPYRLTKDVIKSIENGDMNEYGIPLYSETPIFQGNTNYSVLHLPLTGKLRDLYALVHEISHSFEHTLFDTTTINILGEITPEIFENLLNEFLLKNANKYGLNINSLKSDITNMTLNKVDYGLNDCALMCYLKLKLIDLKKKRIIITPNKLKRTLKEDGIEIGDDELDEYVDMIIDEGNTIDYMSRYMIKELISPTLLEEVKKHKSTIKSWINAIKFNQLDECMNFMGIEMIGNEIYEVSLRELWKNVDNRIKKLRLGISTEPLKRKVNNTPSKPVLEEPFFK